MYEQDGGATQVFNADDPLMGVEWSVNVSDDETRTMRAPDIAFEYLRGGLDPNDSFVWREGMDDWIPLGQCQELLDIIRQYEAGGSQAPAPQASHSPAPAQASHSPAPAQAHPSAPAQASYPPAAQSHSPAPAQAYGSQAPAPYDDDEDDFGSTVMMDPSAQEAVAQAHAAAGQPIQFGSPLGAPDEQSQTMASPYDSSDDYAEEDPFAEARPPAADEGPRRVGERNEASALFSLDQIMAEAKDRESKKSAPGSASSNKGSDDPFADIMSMGGGGGIAGAFAPPPINAPAPPPPPRPQPVVQPSVPPPAAAASMPPGTSMPPGSMAPAASMPPAAMMPASVQPQQKSKTGLIIGAVLAVLVVVGGAAAFLMGGSEEEDPTAQVDDKSGSGDEAKPTSDGDKDEDAKDEDDKDEDAKDDDAKDEDADDDKKDDEGETETAKADDDKKKDDKKSSTTASTTSSKKDDDKKDDDKKKKDDDKKKKDDDKKKDDKKDDKPKSEFNRDAARSALAGAAGAASGCKKAGGPTGRGRVTVTFAPSGRATQATVGPPFAGTAVGSCAAGAFRAASVPPFSGGAVTVSKSFFIK